VAYCHGRRIAVAINAEARTDHNAAQEPAADDEGPGGILRSGFAFDETTPHIQLPFGNHRKGCSRSKQDDTTVADQTEPGRSRRIGLKRIVHAQDPGHFVGSEDLGDRLGFHEERGWRQIGIRLGH
jgi:hypothetical protein